MKPLGITILAVLGLLTFTTTSNPVRAEGTGGASLADLAWISGEWVGGEGDTFIQEHWSTPQGGNMMGMFRLIQKEKVVFYEFMSIDQESSGPILRIKHFNPGLEGWEEKDESIVFDLKEFGDQRAVFFTEQKGEPEMLIYELSGAEFVITLVKPEQDSRTEFRYQRAMG